MGKEFEFPPELLEQINECSNGGFFLAIINKEGNFETYYKYDTSVSELGLLSFTETQVSAQQEQIRQRTFDALSTDGEEEA